MKKFDKINTFSFLAVRHDVDKKLKLACSHQGYSTCLNLHSEKRTPLKRSPVYNIILMCDIFSWAILNKYIYYYLQGLVPYEQGDLASPLSQTSLHLTYEIPILLIHLGQVLELLVALTVTSANEPHSNHNHAHYIHHSILSPTCHTDLLGGRCSG